MPVSGFVSAPPMPCRLNSAPRPVPASTFSVLIQPLSRYFAYGLTGTTANHQASAPSADDIFTLALPVCATVSTLKTCARLDTRQPARQLAVHLLERAVDDHAGLHRWRRLRRLRRITRADCLEPQHGAQPEADER